MEKGKPTYKQALALEKANATRRRNYNQRHGAPDLNPSAPEPEDHCSECGGYEGRHSYTCSNR